MLEFSRNLRRVFRYGRVLWLGSRSLLFFDRQYVQQRLGEVNQRHQRCNQVPLDESKSDTQSEASVDSFAKNRSKQPARIVGGNEMKSSAAEEKTAAHPYNNRSLNRPNNVRPPRPACEVGFHCYQLEQNRLGLSQQESKKEASQEAEERRRASCGSSSCRKLWWCRKFCCWRK